MRVKGTVKEKASTPSNPQISPVTPEDSGCREMRVAVLSSFMFNSSSERLVAVLREWIATAPAGSQLPSTRTLVADYEVSPVTVQKALRILTGQGIIESRPGIGTFVRSHPVARAHDHAWQTAALGVVQRPLPELASAQRATPNDVISLQSGYPDRDLLPERLVRSAFSRVARSDAVLQRTPAAGLPDLQSWFASELGAITAPGLSAPAASDVVVLPGSQSGLGSIFRSLVGAGKPMLIESPTYWGAILAAAQVGVQLVPVPAGPHGPDTGQLDRAFEQTGARAFYAHPNFANPSGAQWSPEVSQRVLEILKNRGAFLVEDDWAKDLGINAESSPMAARDDSGHVVYLRSLTKSVSPAVRVAGVIARGPARERILADNQAQSMYVSGALQSVALDVVTQPGWRTHLRSVRQQLATRRDLVLDALAQHLPEAHVEQVPLGGLNLWARLPDATNLVQLVRDCEMRGVAISAGDSWFPAEPTGRFLRLNFAGPNPGAFNQGVEIIGQVLRA